MVLHFNIQKKRSTQGMNDAILYTYINKNCIQIGRGRVTRKFSASRGFILGLLLVPLLFVITPF